MGFQGPSPPPPVLFCLTGCFVPSITLPWGAGTVEAAPLLGPELVHALQDLRPCPNTGTQPTRGPILWAVHTRCWAKGISFQSLEGAQSGSCLALASPPLPAPHPPCSLCPQALRLGGTCAWTRLWSSSKTPSRWAAPAPGGWAWACPWASGGLGDGCPTGPSRLAVLGRGWGRWTVWPL